MGRVVASMAAAFAVAVLFAVPATAAAAPQPSFTATYEVQLSHHFTLYGYATEHLSVELNGTVLPRNSPLEVTVTFPFTYSDTVGLTPADNLTLFTVPHFYTVLTVQLPSNVSSFDFVVEGTITGVSSLFYKNIAQVPPIFVSMDAAPFAPTMKVNVPVQSLVIRSVSPSNASEAVSIGGVSYLQLSPVPITSGVNPTGVSILYQSPLSDYYAFLVIVGLASVLLIVPIVFRRYWRYLGGLWRRFPATAKSLSRVLLRRRGTRWLLGIFVMLCVLMIAISTIFGPPPRPRAYLAATPSTSETLGPYVTQAGWSYLTPAQARDGFERTSNLGTFSVAIVADYLPEVISSSPYQSGLSYVPHIIVLKQYVPSSYLNELLSAQKYNPVQSVQVLTNTSQLAGALTQLGGRQNVLGLTVSDGTYLRAEQLVGMISLLLPFFALAFLASVVIDVGRGGLGGVFETVGYAIMLYFMAEFALIVSTVMLGTPVAMHAAISHVETTEGLLGPFGGGTRPRQLLGTLGFVFGIVYNSKGALSYDKRVLVALAAVVAFIIADPLDIGNYSYSLLVAVTDWNSGVSGASSIYGTLRGVITQPLVLFRSYLTSTYVASHGDALFFMSALPFVLYSRVGKGTGTLLLLFAALGCGIGFTRIADMVPMETIASAAPGLLVGAALLPVFWVLDKFEAIVRTGSPFR